MTDDNETETESEVTLQEAIDFATDMAEKESNDFEGDVPKHAHSLLAARATDLSRTLDNIAMAEASERAEGFSEEQQKTAITEDAVDILLALGGLNHEYDLDIVGKFEDRMELVADYEALQEAMEDVEEQDEMVEVMDEHMTEELAEVLGVGGMRGQQPPQIEAGVNVDDEDYEHEETDKSFA